MLELMFTKQPAFLRQISSGTIPVLAVVAILLSTPALTQELAQEAMQKPALEPSSILVVKQHDDHSHADVAVFPEHEEPSIVFDTSLTLRSLADMTLERYPQTKVGVAEQATAKAQWRAGKRWLPGGVELSASYISDKAHDDTGAYENEVALNVPMWRLGEKTAKKRYGDSALALSAASQTEMAWNISGQLRDSMWVLTIARRQWQLALDQEQRLTEMLEQVELLHKVGDLSRADLLAAKQELALWRSDTLSLEAEFQDAVREYQLLTGIIRLPTNINEVRSDEQHIDAEHPALQRAKGDIHVAQAGLTSAEKSRNSRPAVQLFWRDSRSDYESADISSVGVGVSIPLGKGVDRAPKIAQANTLLVSAQAALTNTKRLLELQLHEAAHELRTLKRQLDNAKQMIDVANERHQIDKLAFELGDIDLCEWLRRLSQLKEIERTHEQLLLEQGAAIAAYNQAVGVAL